MAFSQRLPFEPVSMQCSTSYGKSFLDTPHCLLHPRVLARPVKLRKHGLMANKVVQNSATAVKGKPRPGEKKGFVEEMRMAAMKLHTRDQAPREGSRPESENPVQQWSPSREGYLRFLAESKAVYDVLEQIVQEAPKAEYAAFHNTGLERSDALRQDISWMQQKYSLPEPQLAADSPGADYARKLQELASSDPAAFICHFYNFYFAHTAGGKMIGRKVSDMILDGVTLEFYKWEGDVKERLEGVRDKLNELSATWSREQKDHCLQETQASFKYSGDILRTIIAPSH